MEKKEKGRVKDMNERKKKGGRKGKWEERRICILNLDIFPWISRRVLICHNFLLAHSIN